MKVIVLNKTAFDNLMESRNISDANVASGKKTFFISINGTVERKEKPYFKEEKPNLKIMFFDDVEEDTKHPRHGFLKAFTEAQAAEILDFLENQKDKELCILHCAAGISRSGAVGQFISDYFECDYEEFKMTNPRVRPNMKVLQLLNRELRKRNGQEIN